MAKSTISRNGWLYKYAYGLSNIKPDRINLCNFFWRCIGMIFVWLFVMACAVIGLIVYGLVPLLFGYRPTAVASFISGDKPGFDPEKDPFAVPFQKWPKIKGIPFGLFHVSVVALATYALILGISYFNVAVVIDWIPAIKKGLMVVLTGLLGILILLISLFLIALPFRGFNRFRKSEMWHLTKELLKAKKEKVCPIITVVE